MEAEGTVGEAGQEGVSVVEGEEVEADRVTFGDGASKST